MVSPDLKDRMIKRLVDYHRNLIDRGFSGRVTMRYDRGVLQREVRKDESEKLMEDGL